MKRQLTRRKFLSATGVAAATLSLANRLPGTSAATNSHQDQPVVLWYDKPASEWTEALPIGNGRLGAMIFGGPASEQLQLNEDTLYAGSPYNPNNPEALKALPEARRAGAATRSALPADAQGACASQWRTPARMLP